MNTVTYDEWLKIDSELKNVLKKLSGLKIDDEVVNRSVVNLSILRHQLRDIPIIK